MELRYISLKNISALEVLSYENAQDRVLEEGERMLLETDDIEVFDMRKDIESESGYLADMGVEKIDEMADGLENMLDLQYGKRRKLMAEKSHLLAETAQKRSAAKTTAKRASQIEPLATKRDELDKIQRESEEIIGRMDYNERKLLRPDRLSMQRRRSHLRRLMGCSERDAAQYEAEFANRMVWAQRDNTHQDNYAIQQKLSDGNVLPNREHGPFIRTVNLCSIATPLSEMDFFGDGGYLGGYLSLMEQMPEIPRLIRKGMSVSDILNDGELRAKAQSLISHERPITVMRVGEGWNERFQTVDIENQRRVVVARLFGVEFVSVMVKTNVRSIGE